MTNTAPNVIATLKQLLAQVPDAPLAVGRVAGDKPGILAGNFQLFRVREGDVGAAFAALTVEAINALPLLISELESASAQPQAGGSPIADESNPVRQQVEAKIMQALALQPGFKEAMLGTWAKLIYAAVEPWLAGGREVLSIAPAESAPAKQEQGEAQIRLEAVADFCSFILTQEDADSRPNEFALEQWVNEWAKENALPLQAGTSSDA